MTDPRIHWSEEAQLIGYGESDSTGAWIKFIIISLVWPTIAGGWMNSPRWAIVSTTRAGRS